jgi:membrane protein implicated in regulation of membrane protease activity
MNLDALIYLLCLGGGFLFLVVLALMGHFFDGAGHHEVGGGGHAEAGADGTDGSGVSAFSPMIIAAFMTGFGAFGYLLTLAPATKSPAISAPLAAVGAFAFANVIVWALRLVFRKTQSSSESQVASVVGTTATLGTGIPENGVGEIVYVQGGTRYTAPARTEDGKAIATGAAVTVTRLVGTQFFVKPA